MTSGPIGRLRGRPPTDLIPKASSARYMGISNVATATSGIFAVMSGGILMDSMNRAAGYGLGPRFAFGLAVVHFGLGALLLRPVAEPARTAASG